MLIARRLLHCYVLAFSLPAIAESPVYEYGTAAELAGVTRVFVDSGPDLNVRDEIAAVIRVGIPALIIAERADDADVVLVFRASTRERYAGSVTNAYPGYSSWGSFAGYQKLTQGQEVVVKVVSTERLRLLLSVEEERVQGWRRDLGKKLAKKFATAFVGAYMAANNGQPAN